MPTEMPVNDNICDRCHGTGMLGEQKEYRCGYCNGTGRTGNLCPYCGGRLLADGLSGALAKCKECGHKMKNPEPKYKGYKVTIRGCDCEYCKFKERQRDKITQEEKS